MYNENFIIDKINNKKYLYHINSKKIFYLDDPTFKRYTAGGLINSEIIYKENPNLLLNHPLENKKTENFIHSKTIKKLVLIMTNSCNLNCVYCYAHGGTYQKKAKTISKDVLIKIFDFLKSNSIKINELQFLGGEPLLASKEIKIVFDLLEKYNIYPKNISMVTNFTYLPDWIIEHLIKWNVYITVSIDGEKDINDLLRKNLYSKSTYELILKNINLFRKKGGIISCAEATYTKVHQTKNFSKINVIESIKNNLNIKDVVINDAINSGNFSNSNIFIDNRSDDNFIDKTHLQPDDVFFIQKLFFTKTSPVHVCSAGSEMLTIFPDGDIYPCQLLISDKYKIGNINSFPEEISNYLRKVKKNKLDYKIEFNTCKDCIARNICKMCLANKELSKKENLCSGIRKNMLINLNKIIEKNLLENIHNLI